jgi:metal-responsive CopG/Arc/MetJ family transcriptional regulator
MGDSMKQSKVGDELDSRPTVRASVSLPQGLHAELERIAREKKVSLAWVMRDAAEKYVADQWPLLTQPK